jgi:hypothetical protein
LANNEKTLELQLRYEISYSRMHDRAMKALTRLQDARLKEARTNQEPLQNEVPPALGSTPEPVCEPAVTTTCEPTEPETQNLQNDAKPQPPRPSIEPFPSIATRQAGRKSY